LLGLACWAGTTLIVESEFFRPVRAFCDKRRSFAIARWIHYHDGMQTEAPAPEFGVRTRWVYDRLAYLVSCHWCTGVWVALVLTALFGAYWDGWYGFIASALVVKAIAHLVLELRPQAWMSIRSARVIENGTPKW
jgi:hypothetical protein